MNHRPATNSATLILLRISLIIASLFTALFLVLTQTQNHPACKPLAIMIVLSGMAFLVLALRDLLRELNRESSANRQSQSNPTHF